MTIPISSENNSLYNWSFFKFKSIENPQSPAIIISVIQAANPPSDMS